MAHAPPAHGGLAASTENTAPAGYSPAEGYASAACCVTNHKRAADSCQVQLTVAPWPGMETQAREQAQDRSQHVRKVLTWACRHGF